MPLRYCKICMVRLEKKTIWKGYMGVGYLSDPHEEKSQTFFLCLVAIPWRSTKLRVANTSSNHPEIGAMHEASHAIG